MSATLVEQKKPETTDQNSIWLDAKNAAEYLGVSRRTLRRWLIEETIPKDAHKYIDTHRGSQNFFKAEVLSKIKQERSFGSLDQLGTILKEAAKKEEVQPLEFFNLIDRYQPQIDNLNKVIIKEKTKNTAKTTILCFLMPMFIIACAALYFQYKNHNIQIAALSKQKGKIYRQLQEKEQSVTSLQAQNKFLELKANEAEK